jgi:glycosyltransferase involved in cell wall biosynthesis
MIKLTIAIPTIFGREEQFNSLLAELERQKEPYYFQVEILWHKDNKEMSIGAKRNLLYKQAKGAYTVLLDDDDTVAPDYIAKVMEALKQEPDCVGYLEQCTMDGVVKIACHSNRFKDWKDNYGGYDYARTIFYKDVIKTSIAQKVQVRDMRFGEDHNFAKRLKVSGLLKKEVFINEIMYYYSYQTMSKSEHLKRYGIIK